jgi:hypothetical protein
MGTLERLATAVMQTAYAFADDFPDGKTYNWCLHCIAKVHANKGISHIEHKHDCIVKVAKDILEREM